MKRGRLALALIILTGANLLASAEELALHLDTTLSLRSDAWSSSRRLDDTRGIGQVSMWGRTKLKLDTGNTLVADGWIHDQTRNKPDTPHGRVRELYWRYDNGALELKVGRQMVVWGRADGLNPTDNLSPRDFTLLVPEDGDARHGNDVAQMSMATDIGTISTFFFPHAASHTIPLASQPNVNYTATDAALHRPQWAMKWEAGGNGIDGSISYFHGVDLMPDLSIASLGPAGLEIAVRNNPVRIFGGDLSFIRNGVVWRAEAAWMQTDSEGANDFTRKKPQFQFVAGGEWTLASDTTLGIQGTLQRVSNFQSPDSIAQSSAREVAWRQAATSNQIAATQTGMTWRLASRWWNDTLLTETSGVILWPSSSGVWRTKLAYALNDHWHWQVGTDYYFGPAYSFFGQLGKNRLLYAQLRCDW